MKTSILILLGAVCIAGNQFAADKPVEKNGWVCRTKQQDLELRDWIGGIQNEAHKAKESAKAAQASNVDLQGKLKLASSDGIELAKERDQAVIDKDHVLKKLHLAKWIFTVLVTALVVLFCLWLKIPPPVLWFALGGGLAIGNGLVWWLV